MPVDVGLQLAICCRSHAQRSSDAVSRPTERLRCKAVELPEPCVSGVSPQAADAMRGAAKRLWQQRWEAGRILQPIPTLIDRTTPEYTHRADHLYPAWACRATRQGCWRSEARLGAGPLAWMLRSSLPVPPSTLGALLIAGIGAGVQCFGPWRNLSHLNNGLDNGVVPPTLAASDATLRA
jgi:hypothetical protein